MSNHIVLLWHPSFENEDCFRGESHQGQTQVANERAKRSAQTRKAGLVRQRALAPFISENGMVNFGDLRMYDARSSGEDGEAE